MIGNKKKLAIIVLGLITIILIAISFFIAVRLQQQTPGGDTGVDSCPAGVDYTGNSCPAGTCNDGFQFEGDLCPYTFGGDCDARKEQICRGHDGAEPGRCPNDSSLTPKACIILECPNGDTDNDGRCTASDQGAIEVYKGPELDNCIGKTTTCGQIDYFTIEGDYSEETSFCGYTNLTVTNCNDSTPTPSPSIQVNKRTINIGGNINDPLSWTTEGDGPDSYQMSSDPNNPTYIYYLIRVTNNGNVNLPDVLLRDRFDPKYLKFVKGQLAMKRQNRTDYLKGAVIYPGPYLQTDLENGYHRLYFPDLLDLVTPDNLREGEFFRLLLQFEAIAPTPAPTENRATAVALTTDSSTEIVTITQPPTLYGCSPTQGCIQDPNGVALAQCQAVCAERYTCSNNQCIPAYGSGEYTSPTCDGACSPTMYTCDPIQGCIVDPNGTLTQAQCTTCTVESFECVNPDANQCRARYDTQGAYSDNASCLTACVPTSGSICGGSCSTTADCPNNHYCSATGTCTLNGCTASTCQNGCIPLCGGPCDPDGADTCPVDHTCSASTNTCVLNSCNQAGVDCVNGCTVIPDTALFDGENGNLLTGLLLILVGIVIVRFNLIGQLNIMLGGARSGEKTYFDELHELRKDSKSFERRDW